eukprot:Phypoly_transcript_12762.p1 GENE.Phypoly_transcript_12762~~Phypoly_transcript_12762.p1  ORF type:complete len:307 (+),score=44.96 Phypoly_transcript_12762:82-1002(+)
MATSTNPPQKKKPWYIPYVLGGLSGMSATCVVQPVDLIKTRMQLSGEMGKAPAYRSSFHALTSIAQTEGIRNLYKGLSAGLLRQATYGTTRFGAYNNLSRMFTSTDENGKPKPLNFGLKLLAGSGAGAIGAVVGTPAEIALIRMTSDGRLPPEQRRGYKNVFDALLRMSREEGVVTMWRGCGPTVGRAVILNAAQLGTYDQAKQMLLQTGMFGNNLGTHFTASLISGFISTAVSIPIDMAKTRIQNMKHGEYKGALDCIFKTAKNEGVFSLWKGFTPYFLRLGPHTIITFIVLEQMNKLYDSRMNK